jgi:hypothetical protein
MGCFTHSVRQNNVFVSAAGPFGFGRQELADQQVRPIHQASGAEKPKEIYKAYMLLIILI